MGDAADSIWEEAVKQCEGEQVSDVWEWGLQDTSIEKHEVRPSKWLMQKCYPDSDDSSQKLLRESMTDNHGSPTLYRDLFYTTLSSIYIQPTGIPNPTTRRKAVMRLLKTYLPTSPSIHEHAFALEAAHAVPADIDLLQDIYALWVRIDETKEHAALVWAGWLLQNMKVKEAGDIIQNVGRELGGVRKEELEVRWRKVLDGDFGQVTEEDVDEEMADGSEDTEQDEDEEDVELQILT